MLRMQRKLDISICVNSVTVGGRSGDRSRRSHIHNQAEAKPSLLPIIDEDSAVAAAKNAESERNSKALS